MFLGSSALKAYNGGARKRGCGSQRIQDSRNSILPRVLSRMKARLPLYTLRGRVTIEREKALVTQVVENPRGGWSIGELDLWALCVLSLLLLYIRVSSWVLAPYVKECCAIAAQCGL